MAELINVSSRGGFALAARWLALGASTWTSLISIMLPQSSAARSLDGSGLALWLNVSILVLAAVGWADVIWHDIRGRLIWPSLASHTRHHVCVTLYAAIGAVFVIRAFVVLGLPIAFEDFVIAGWYLTAAAGCGLVAVSIATESRE